MFFRTAQGLGFDVRFSKESINALQEASERHLVHFFNTSNKYAIHAKRVMVLGRDMKLAMDTLTKPWDINSDFENYHFIAKERGQMCVNR